jgi:hypothetical protein
MSRSFNCARAEIVARRDGITYREACARIGGKGGRTAGRRRRTELRIKRIKPWWLREEL